jgi:hypothetical protein
MPTKAEKLRIYEQGYCHSGNRPQCSNCQYLIKGSHPHICLIGNFEPTHSGWCPSWLADDDYKARFPNIVDIIYRTGELCD